MKTPIKFEDIRVGDVVEQRFEHEGCKTRRRGTVTRVSDAQSGNQWVVTIGHSSGLISDGATRWFLLDRPTVSPLPTTPTFGLLTWKNVQGGTVQRWDVWEVRHKDYLYGSTQEINVPNERITEWSPMRSVPVSALDELRQFSSIEGVAGAYDRIDTFLTAVDAATGAQA